jgi:hypothetical protein
MDRRLPGAIATQRWVVATEDSEGICFLCGGYRDEPAVTSDVTTAEHFASPMAAETARDGYLRSHRNCAHGLTGWRVLVAMTRTSFRGG